MGKKVVDPVARQANAAILGYATRSLRSALVMRAIDLLPAAPRHPEPPELRGTCVIASVAGVGDLFIHLPLIQGIVAKVLENGGSPLVALRPAHAEIGRACGWTVVEFENPLQDLFGGTVNGKVLRAVLRDTRGLRRLAPDLWLDLTGNAFNALNLRLGGIRRLGARVTRGGAGFVRYEFPNQPFENEYVNRERLAQYLGCRLHPDVFQRLTKRRRGGHVLIGLTTNCRWKNWPIERFLELMSRFPHVQFVVTGMRGEISKEDAPAYEQICRLPNVIDKVGINSLMDLIAGVASAAAVITNDTGTAHIATAYDVPGAVLFGPTSSAQWTGGGSLRLFHDQSCPLHPCVAWSCARPSSWCMKKIGVDEVAHHLDCILRREQAGNSEPA